MSSGTQAFPLIVLEITFESGQLESGSKQGPAIRLDWIDIFVKVRIHFHCVGRSHIRWLFDGNKKWRKSVLVGRGRRLSY